MGKEITKMLTKDMIIAVNDIHTERVEVPEWGGHVFVRTMSLGDKKRYEAELYEIDDKGKVKIKSDGDYKAVMLASCVCNEKGEKLFTMKDIQAISEKSAAPIERILEVANKMNKHIEEDIEEIEKN